ncbi:MAG TPA: hypothetical protein VHO03_00105 [Ignavibacteriales bacterium]|nr:hypothetical protein [Ignavibacteriales bacterium]
MAPVRIPGKLFLVLTAFFLCQNLIFSQDLVEQYSKYLPEMYTRGQYRHEQLLKLLREKSSLHPDLIYYYTVYYNKLNENSFRREKDDIRFKLYLNSIENSLIEKRNAWADRQIAVIDTMHKDPELKKRAQSLFSDLKSDLMKVPSNPEAQDSLVNENLLNFFTVYFYNPASYAKYHPDLRYSGYRKKEEDKLKAKTLSLYETSSRKDAYSNEELVSLILKRWYLLDLSPAPGEMVTNLLKQNDALTNHPNFSLGVNYSPFNYACNLNPSIEIKGLGRQEEFEFRNSIPQIGFSLGYRYYLKDVRGLFSSINFQFSFFTGASSKELSGSPGFSKAYAATVYNYHEDLKFSRFMVTPRSAQSFYMKVSTPMLFLLNTIGVDLGVYGGMNSLKYRFEYEYKYVKTESYYTGSMWETDLYTNVVASGAEKKEYESTKNDIIISPVLELSASSMEAVSMGITVSLQYSSFFFQYEF